MRPLRFKKLDAFAAPGSSGNPAVAVYLDSEGAIGEAEMQRVARELKGFVSEVGFVARSGAETLSLRYFSSEKEVEFCGHATVAILHDLVTHDRDLAHAARILVHTNKGVLPVENRVQAEDAVYVHAPAPTFTDCQIPWPEICEVLGVPEGAADESMELGIVNAGLQTLCVPLRGLRDVVSASPSLQILDTFCRRHALDIVTTFTRDVADAANRLRTRVFAAPFGYLEDPATGSGNAALGFHLHRIGIWDGSPIRIEQGADIAHPNLVRLASVADRGDEIRVIFGGSAILRLEGTYWL